MAVGVAGRERVIVVEAVVERVTVGDAVEDRVAVAAALALLEVEYPNETVADAVQVAEAVAAGVGDAETVATGTAPGFRFPQQLRNPVTLSIAQVCARPALSAPGAATPGSGAGTSLCPNVLSPQQATLPLRFAAHAWYQPALNSAGVLPERTPPAGTAVAP